MKLVLGVSGGIAAYKAALLLRLFTEAGYEVTVVPTAAALRFVGEPTWAALSGRPVATDVWTSVHEVPHVRLGHEADLVVVAPATADLLARAAHGQADDLLTNTLLTARCPILMAPAMHTEMWTHPATAANVTRLREHGVHVLDPASGRLTGVDTGPGRLPEPEEIFAAAVALVDRDEDGTAPGQGSDRHTPGSADPLAGDLAGRHVVVSAGGTREPLDPVRFLGNRSSGKQGYALAEAAAARGARVTLVSANSDLLVPAGVEVVRIETALELQEAVRAALPGADAVVMAAAVADFRPRDYQDNKIKKTHGEGQQDAAPTIELVRNPDILAGLVAERGTSASPVIVGFAAETGDASGDVLTLARAKLARKGCDLLVANEVGRDVTFGKDDSMVHLLRPDSEEVRTVGPAPKLVVAGAVWDEVADLLTGHGTVPAGQ
ncbi:bifunctional phosphopantothenoylcysteine decarboxylase/phosphopantothenate synthase [Ornithinimicrobium sp. F0845]|uniref:bifunctional phosphopantothenoylcysteine decarboxylase/phosphopantothenate synthase n=1 Tax=Ornithinimicrobium sp. F0845 TaxID=2926412 RepID=UPI001FF164D6|nr:bifunctional phosphopantothenoylcysteine decarboxylase/phosphopantothenate synthase [Ornithinimicrobium sp. F0845]MCK0114239.1 bifunctional phosphopantothenoylcysteine decarboxylase/phosphopantothenate synthase [Ornithinimicrobium sp. F0845]